MADELQIGCCGFQIEAYVVVFGCYRASYSSRVLGSQSAQNINNDKVMTSTQFSRTVPVLNYTPR
jgi:hypothetical protein